MAHEISTPINELLINKIIKNVNRYNGAIDFDFLLHFVSLFKKSYKFSFSILILRSN